MPLPNEAKYFADLNAATTEADTHLLALQQGSPPVGGATPTPTRKWTLLALRTWLQGFFVRGPASVTADRIALFDGTTGRLLKQGAAVGTALDAISSNQMLSDGTDRGGALARHFAQLSPGSTTSSDPIFVLGRFGSNVALGAQMVGKIIGRVTNPSGNVNGGLVLNVGYFGGVREPLKY